MCIMNTITVDDYQLEILKEVVREHLSIRIDQAKSSCAAGHRDCIEYNLDHLACVVEILEQLEWAMPCKEPAIGEQGSAADTADEPATENAAAAQQ